jgi:CheY-like chemotaxis protein
MNSYTAPRALIADDEPEYLEWLRDYLKSKKLEVDVVTTVRDAVRSVSTLFYRVVLIDMSIPPAGSISRDVQERQPLVKQYPGLAIAIHARTAGYKPAQLIVYTVHDDDSIEQMLANIGAAYVLKGRPEEIKEAIVHAINASPRTRQPEAHTGRTRKSRRGAAPTSRGSRRGS